jgi:hypothetical protein
MRYAFVSLLILLSLLGCRASKPATSSSVIEGIVVDVWASSDCVHPGETPKLRATATNHDTITFSVELTDRPVFDLVVRTTDKTTRWSDGKPLTPDLTRLELKSGKSKTLEMDGPVQCCDSLMVTAPFIYSPKFADYPATPGVIVNVQHCRGPLGP